MWNFWLCSTGRFWWRGGGPLFPPGGPGSVFALCCQKVIDDFLKFRENLLTDLNWSVKRICGPSQGAKVIVNLQRFAEWPLSAVSDPAVWQTAQISKWTGTPCLKLWRRPASSRKIYSAKDAGVRDKNLHSACTYGFSALKLDRRLPKLERMCCIPEKTAKTNAKTLF